MNIVITGFMASGKTTISNEIAAMSNYEFIDTDELLEKNEGITINEIFAKYGEEYFREREHETIKKVSCMDNMVISTGGGVVLNKANMAELRKNGVIFNLAPDFEVIRERLEAAAATRPLLQNQDIADVKRRFEARRPFYDDCDYKIKIVPERTARSCAIEILDIIKSRKNSI